MIPGMSSSSGASPLQGCCTEVAFVQCADASSGDTLVDESVFGDMLGERVDGGDSEFAAS